MVLKLQAYILIVIIFTVSDIHATDIPAGQLILNGKWEMGFDKLYDREVIVPGIHIDPSVINPKRLWYRKSIELPEGNWKNATLELKGARFRPEVYINGSSIGTREGGMAPVFIELKHPQIIPGETVTIEIALASLKEVPETDASYIPVADQWRTNVSSGLWDDIVLHLHGNARIRRIIPFTRLMEQSLQVKFDLESEEQFNGKYRIEIIEKNGKVLLTRKGKVRGNQGSIDLDLENKLETWTPEEPELYKLRLSIYDNKGSLTDQSEISYGFKSFSIEDKKFLLNDQPFTARGVTVVWPRWMRTDEGRELGYDTEWFYENIIKRTKDLGGNYLRFHLGLPPERLLDLCDQHGLVVQFEWSFFHGMPASKESLLVQYREWLDLAMAHPSVSIIHPYNETYGNQLDIVWAALDELLPDYPSLVLEERDVIHVHKYWWSLFENLGLYYDSYDDFPKAIMVDEFGGNYLDGEGNYGGYPKVKEAFGRFLGRQHTAEERLKFQVLSNVKVAEYWRRIGAAGVSPFCALGSHEDGNHWFLGPLREGKPKPVWEALAPVFSPRSVSMELWDRNFAPGQVIELPIYLFNDEEDAADFRVRISIIDNEGSAVLTRDFQTRVGGYQHSVDTFEFNMPGDEGKYLLKTSLLNPPKGVKYPVYSEWEIRIHKAKMYTGSMPEAIGIPEFEKELNAFFKGLGIRITQVNDDHAEVIVTSREAWDRIAGGDVSLQNALGKAIEKGTSVVMLDVGERNLGKGYPKGNGELGNLQGQEKLTESYIYSYELLSGITLTFTEAVESESHMHANNANNALWAGIPEDYTWLWNGYRGGLLVPASNMEISGLNSNAFISQWEEKGADKQKIIDADYYAYELDGYYEFSRIPGDASIKKKLRDKIQFLLEDAPALAISINPDGPIEVRNLHEAYKFAKQGIAEQFESLAECGKGLTRTPVALISFGEEKGNLIVSQLLTAGRLAKGYGEDGLYGVRKDEVARQFVLNMISLVYSENQ
jgi:hypothetical protein